jgi:hypothetical protein
MGVDLPISGLPDAIPLDDADLIALVQAGVTNRATLGMLLDFVQSDTSALAVMTESSAGWPAGIGLYTGSLLPLTSTLDDIPGMVVGIEVDDATVCVVILHTAIEFSGGAGSTTQTDGRAFIDGVGIDETSWNISLDATSAIGPEAPILHATTVALVSVPAGVHSFNARVRSAVNTTFAFLFDASLLVFALPRFLPTERDADHTTFARITESGDIRITESGDIRITE